METIDPVTIFQNPRRPTGVVLIALGVVLSAGASAQPTLNSRLSGITPSGNYLSARHAEIERDATAAATNYRAVLKADPDNAVLLERAFLAMLSSGEVDDAVHLADDMARVGISHRLAQLERG